MEAVAIVAIISSVGALITIFAKTIKKSSCAKCIDCESRTPPPSASYVEPVITQQPPMTPKPSPNINVREIAV